MPWMRRQILYNFITIQAGLRKPVWCVDSVFYSLFVCFCECQEENIKMCAGLCVCGSTGLNGVHSHSSISMVNFCSVAWSWCINRMDTCANLCLTLCVCVCEWVHGAASERQCLSDQNLTPSHCSEVYNHQQLVVPPPQTLKPPDQQLDFPECLVSM